MGNQVIIAIRHGVKEVPSFLDLYNKLSHCEDRTLKSFDEYGDILFSHYYHASYDVTLAVNNKGMHFLPVWLNLHSNLQEKPILNRILNDIRTYQQASITKLPKSSKREANTGESITIFGFLCDNIRNIPDSAIETLIEEIPYVESIKNDKIISSANYFDEVCNLSIVKIGTIDADQTAFVEMRGNVFYATALSSTKMEAKSTDSIPELFKSFAHSLGYNYKLKSDNS